MSWVCVACLIVLANLGFEEDFDFSDFGCDCGLSFILKFLMSARWFLYLLDWVGVKNDFNSDGWNLKIVT